MTSWLRCARWVAREVGGGLAELLLPGCCAACGRGAPGPLCEDCLRSCRAPAGPCCLRCGAPWTRRRGTTAAGGGGGDCGRCRRFGRPFAFASAAGLWRYRGPVRRLVHAFKYDGRQDLLAPLGRLLAGSPRPAGLAGGSPHPLVVAVPARRASLRRRGYDQAAGLAAGFAAARRLRCDARALVRRRESGPQAGRSVRRRLLQAAAAFRARPSHVHGLPILLVDDVLSTGATADACSRALLRAGATSVRVITLAT